MILLLCGPEAERKYARRRNKIGARGDFENASILALEVAGEAATEYLQYCEKCAELLVRDNWELVHSVASELLEKMELTGDQVGQIIENTLTRRG